MSRTFISKCLRAQQGDTQNWCNITIFNTGFTIHNGIIVNTLKKYKRISFGPTEQLSDKYPEPLYKSFVFELVNTKQEGCGKYNFAIQDQTARGYYFQVRMERCTERLNISPGKYLATYNMSKNRIELIIRSTQQLVNK